MNFTGEGKLPVTLLSSDPMDQTIANVTAKNSDSNLGTVPDWVSNAKPVDNSNINCQGFWNCFIVEKQYAEWSIFLFGPIGILSFLLLAVLAIAGYYCYNKHRQYRVGVHDEEAI